MTDDCKLILVDGSGYIFRAYHAMPPLTRGDGTAVGAVYGYCTMLTKLMEQFPKNPFAVIFDAGRVTFRNEIYSDYKANRDAPPEDLVPQFGLVREATKAFNLPSIELPGFEADDLIASYAKAAAEQGHEVMIVSSDKDLMQLMRDGVEMYDPMKAKLMGLEDVEKKFGVTPEKVTQVQALMGDSVDNIPGVPGIGPKTAALLIHEFGDLETLLERAGEIKQNKRRESLIEHADAARMSFKLVTLDEEVPLPQPVDELGRAEIPPEPLYEFLQEQRFNSLVRRWQGKLGGDVPAAPADTAPNKANDATSNSEYTAPVAPTEKTYTLVQDEATLADWVEKIQRAGLVAFDTETTGLDVTQAELVGICLSVKAGEACYIPVAHVSRHCEKRSDAATSSNQTQEIATPSARNDGMLDLFAESAEPKLVEGQLSMEVVLNALRPILADTAILKVGQNMKYDMGIMRHYDCPISPVADTMLMSYAANAGLHSHGMDELSERYLGEKPIAFKEVVGSGKSQKLFSEVPLEEARDYAAEDADLTLRLYHALLPSLREKKVTTVYERIERPLIDVIAQMEAEGILVNPDALKRLSNQFAQEMAGLETEIHKAAGREFNIGSPKQLGEILFDEMGIEGGKKSAKTGAYTTGAEILEELAVQGHVIAEKVLEWRGLSKLKSTYTDALQTQVNPKTGRVHTSFSMASTTTGRLSSSDPNLQNIPVRTESGKKIREAFIAAPGTKLISADYSQIELRLLAHVAEMEELREAFRQGRDIHAATASQMFGVPLDEVDSELRRKAKTINFGIIYGISAHGLAVRLGIGRPEAAEYIKTYFAQYPGIQDYMERTKEFAREHGYVQTLFGRKVHTKDIAAKNGNLRAFAERAAINAPLQGTAADIIKRAMVACQRLVDEENRHCEERSDAAISSYKTQEIASPSARNDGGAKMLLQVHDELIFEVSEDKAEAFAEKVKKAMARACEPMVQLSIPLVVEAGVGDNWGEIH